MSFESLCSALGLCISSYQSASREFSPKGNLPNSPPCPARGHFPNSLDDDGFLVFAEDAAEGVGDFADGGVGFDGGEDGGEEIFGGGGAGPEFGEGGLGAGGVAFGAEGV